MALSGHGINYLASSEVVGEFAKYWMISNAVTTGNKFLAADESNRTNWNSLSNWTGNAIPGPSDNVIIPAVPPEHSPILPDGVVVNSLTIEPGAVLNAGSGTLTIKGGIGEGGGIGSWNNAGTFNAGTTKVIFDFERKNNQTLETATISGATEFYDVEVVGVTTGTFLVMQAGSSMSVKNSITISGNSTFDASTFNNTVIYNGAAQTIVNPNGGSTGGGYHSLTLSSSGSLTWSASAYNVGGHFTNNIENLIVPQPIVLNGSSIEQTIGGAYPTTFTNLTVNSNAGVALDKGVTVTTGLTLTNGVVSTGDNTVAVTGTLSGGSASSYVSGKLAQTFVGAGAKNFPIGKGGNYRPLAFTYVTLEGTSTITAEQIEGALPGALPGNYSLFGDRYWSLNETGGSNFSYNVGLDGTDYLPVHAGAVVMYKGNGTTATQYAVTKVSETYTNSTAFTSFSDFGLGEGPLVWTGVTDSDWSTDGNWNPVDVPTAASNASIPDVTNKPVVSDSPGSPAQVNNLVIESGAALTIAAGGALTVNGTLTNDAGTSGLVIQSTSSGEGGTDSLIHNSAGVSATVERFIAQHDGDIVKGWHLLSSPVASQDIRPEFFLASSVDSDYSLVDFYRWDETLNVNSVIGGWSNIKSGSFGAPTSGAAQATNTFTVGRGYLMAYKQLPSTKSYGDKAHQFMGTINTGDVTMGGLTFTASSDHAGWNLLGNPFASAIQWGGWTTDNI